jgi:hypothetical protein
MSSKTEIMNKQLNEWQDEMLKNGLVPKTYKWFCTNVENIKKLNQKYNFNVQIPTFWNILRYDNPEDKWNDFRFLLRMKIEKLYYELQKLWSRNK